MSYEQFIVSHAAIQTAMLIWNEQGTPVSKQFNNVYFSNQNGLEETRYVFLKALLNKSNIWPARGSDHSPSVKIATFR
ncbi:MAG: hypothetical protein G5700_01925, partial [Serratia symbiotica]|nr:hypothetical protein [Serratia symbiotica]